MHRHRPRDAAELTERAPDGSVDRRHPSRRRHRCDGVRVINRIRCERPVAPRREVRINMTAFVDARYGSDDPAFARLGEPARPFRTIAAAVAAVPANASAPAWTVQVSPGDYPEDVSRPDWVDLAGAGPDQTLVRSVSVSGNNYVSALTVLATALPAISGTFAAEGVNGTAWVQNVNIQYPRASGDRPSPAHPAADRRGTRGAQEPNAIVHVAQTRGINAQLYLDTVTVSADLTGLGAGDSAVIFDRGMGVTAIDVIATASSHPDGSLSLGAGRRRDRRRPGRIDPRAHRADLPDAGPVRVQFRRRDHRGPGFDRGDTADGPPVGRRRGCAAAGGARRGGGEDAELPAGRGRGGGDGWGYRVPAAERAAEGEEDPPPAQSVVIAYARASGAGKPDARG